MPQSRKRYVVAASPKPFVRRKRRHLCLRVVAGFARPFAGVDHNPVVRKSCIDRRYPVAALADLGRRMLAAPVAFAGRSPVLIPSPNFFANSKSRSS